MSSQKRVRSIVVAALYFSLVLSVGFAQRQTPNPGPLPRGAVEPADRARVGASDLLLGSVVSGEVTPGTLDLSLPDAVQRGLRYNLGVITGGLGERRAAAARLTQLSNLLPTLTGRVVESSQQVNLQAFGFGGFPGVPTIVGPFQVFDVRAALTQAVLDISALSNWRSARESVRSAQEANRNVRDLVVLSVVNLYLQAITGRARVEAVQAQIATAEAEYRQATNLKSAGVVAGIDVLRAQVQLQAEQQRGIALRNEFEREKLDLARAIGLPPGQSLALSTDIPYTPEPGLALEDAIRRGFERRPDYQASLSAERAAEWQQRAAKSARLPAVYFTGDYGTIGPSVRENHSTYTAALGVQFPIFEGGRIRAAIEQAQVNSEERHAETSDLRGRIEYEIRTAFLNLRAAREQVDVAQSARKLAAEQLVQARDRFAAGVANNLEVVQAQQAVALAEESYISSLYAFNLAKASLGRSVGSAQSIPSEFLGVPVK